MKKIIGALLFTLSGACIAAEPVYLECKIPDKPGSYTGADGKVVAMNDPAITLKITLNEGTGKVSQVFESEGDEFAFSADAQYTPTEILYEWTRKKGFLRTDRFVIDRVNLGVTLVVEYLGKGTLKPRQGECKVVPRVPTQI